MSVSGSLALEFDVTSYQIVKKVIDNFACLKKGKNLYDRPVVLKVDEIVHLGSILMGKGANKAKGVIGGKTTQSRPKHSTTTANRSWS